jgi:hypothetical protein
MGVMIENFIISIYYIGPKLFFTIAFFLAFLADKNYPYVMIAFISAITINFIRNTYVLNIALDELRYIGRQKRKRGKKL